MFCLLSLCTLIDNGGFPLIDRSMPSASSQVSDLVTSDLETGLTNLASAVACFLGVSIFAAPILLVVFLLCRHLEKSDVHSYLGDRYKRRAEGTCVTSLKKLGKLACDLLCSYLL